jgi:hypothetical protein
MNALHGARVPNPPKEETAMKIDEKELRQVAAAGQPRLDMYAGIHKALRALMADTLLAVGRMDNEDDLEVAQVTQRVHQLLDFCRSHLEHENEHVHKAIEARAAGASERIAHEHEDHVRHIVQLAAAATAVLDTPAADRASAALQLYRELALYIADNFHHMHVEETAHNAVLWARYTDAELAAIQGALIASIPPEEFMFALRWLVPFMNPAERATMLADMRLHAPAPAFEGALAVVRPHLTGSEWAKLAKALAL